MTRDPLVDPKAGDLTFCPTDKKYCFVVRRNNDTVEYVLSECRNHITASMSIGEWGESSIGEVVIYAAD